MGAMHELVILLAEYLIVVSVLLVAGYWLYLPKTTKKRFVLVALVGAALALLLAKLGSALYYNPRPFVVGHYTPFFTHANDNGFPSDHTLLAAFLGFLVLRYSRRLGALLLFLAVLIGTSRVIAGVHHPIDVVGSIVFAAIGLTLAAGLDLRLASRAKQRHNSSPKTSKV